MWSIPPVTVGPLDRPPPRQVWGQRTETLLPLHSLEAVLILNKQNLIKVFNRLFFNLFQFIIKKILFHKSVTCCSWLWWWCLQQWRSSWEATIPAVGWLWTRDNQACSRHQELLLRPEQTTRRGLSAGSDSPIITRAVRSCGSLNRLRLSWEEKQIPWNLN